MHSRHATGLDSSKRWNMRFKLANEWSAKALINSSLALPLQAFLFGVLIGQELTEAGDCQLIQYDFAAQGRSHSALTRVCRASSVSCTFSVKT